MSELVTGRASIADSVAHNEWGTVVGAEALDLAAKLPDALADDLARLLTHVDEAGFVRGLAEEEAVFAGIKAHFPGLVPALELVYAHIHGDEIDAPCQARRGPLKSERDGCTLGHWPPPPPA